jgi:DNA-binding transcriptional LysR family regulator
MDLDLALVRAFAVTAEELHFGRAGQRLGISQQALSKRIRRLEDALGVPLFERSTRSTALTQAGRRLLGPAAEVLAAGEAAVASVRRAGTPLRIDVLHDRLGPARLLAALRDSNPGVRLELSARRGLTLALPALRRSEVDAVFGRLSQLVPATGLDHTLIRLEPLVAIVDADHPLARDAPAPPGDAPAPPGDTTAPPGDTTAPPREATAPPRDTTAPPRDATAPPRDATALAGATTATPAQLRAYGAWVPHPGSAVEWAGYVQLFTAEFGIPLSFEPDDDVGAEQVRRRCRAGGQVFLTAADVANPNADDLRTIRLVHPTPVYPWSLLWRTSDRRRPLHDFVALLDDLGTLEGWRAEDLSECWLPEEDRAALTGQ